MRLTAPNLLTLPVAMALFAGCGAGGAIPRRGFADLHAHPASHLAFGHRDDPGDSCNASEGIFHGSPGTHLDLDDQEATLADDLRPCEPTRHAECPNPSLIQNRQRTLILNTLENRFGTHLPNGNDTYEGWPHASSRTHQQMHLKWLHRAYEGGLRLMIASVTDNEVLSKWYQDDQNCVGGVFQPEDGFAFNSAIRQINFIRGMADSNSEWMGIATDAAEAQALLDDDKLVLILGVEMDALTLEEIFLLIDQGVRSVIPIHLTDNEFGGAAVYDGLFNTLSGWQNRSFFEVVGDERLTFRLGRPQQLTEKRDIPGCYIEPEAISFNEWQNLGYECLLAMEPPECVENGKGHRNAKGLTDREGIRQLMCEGILLDMAHMSWQATEDTLSLAEEIGFPVINSHTGVRRDGPVESPSERVSERGLLISHAKRIGRLGGIIGLGTEGEPERNLIASGRGAPLARLNGGVREWREYMRADDEKSPEDLVEQLIVRISTGIDDLRGGDGLLCNPSRASLAMHHRNGSLVVVDANLADGAGLAGKSVHEVTLEAAEVVSASLLPLSISDISGFTLTRTSGGGCLHPDNWNIDGFTVEFLGNTAASAATGGILVERHGSPYRRLTDERPSFMASTDIGSPRLEALRDLRLHQLEFAFMTGGDDLHSGTGGNLTLHIALKDGRTLTKPVRSLTGFDGGFGAHQSARGIWDLMSEPFPILYGNIESLYFSEHSSGSQVDWDNWDMDSLQVVMRGCMGRDCETVLRSVLAAREAGDLKGEPTWRATMEQPSYVAWQGLRGGFAPGDKVHVLGVSVVTGGDDLRTGSNAELIVRLANGNEQAFPLNRGSLWDNETKHEVMPIVLGFPVNPKDIVSVGLRTDFAGGDSGDNWNVDRFVIEDLRDPVSAWRANYLEALEALAQPNFDDETHVGLDYVPVALGTDFNGLSPQIPFFGAAFEPPLDSHRPPLPPNTLENLPEEFRIARGEGTGQRGFLFGTSSSGASDGLAHIGMVPDFLDTAVSGSDRRMDLIFDSAQATIDTWRRSEEVATAIRLHRTEACRPKE